MARCCLAIGGNSVDSKLAFVEAIEALRHFGVNVVALSSTMTTPAMGKVAGNDFLNAAAVATTNLPAVDTLSALHEVESKLGRKRIVHWGPRIIDLDLLFYEDQVIDTDVLVLPHPSLWYRRFVLQPLVEIAADWMHPMLKETVTELYSRLNHAAFHIEAQQCAVTRSGELQHVVSSLWPDHDVNLQVVTGDRRPAQDVFARFIQTPPRVRAQPALETARIIRVPVNIHAEADEKAQWTQFLTDFKTAAFV